MWTKNPMNESIIKSTTEKAIVEIDFYTMRVKIDFFTRYVFMQGVNTRFNVS